MTPLYDCPDAVTAFVESGLFQPGRKFGLSTAIGFANKTGALVAGFVFHNFEPESGAIEISGFSTQRRWATKRLLNVIFDYPFHQLGCRIVVARHSEHNTTAIRIWRALGANQTTVPELRDCGEAEIVSVLTAKDWKNSKFYEVING